MAVPSAGGVNAIDRLLADFDAGNVAALARAVSVVENHRPGFDRLLAALHSRTGKARRIGLTGPPGAGKSTLTTGLTAAYRAAGLTVGVVAVDPTSPFTGGALLGDRIRMESVALDPGVFIRSMATRGSLGGLAAATREVADRLRQELEVMLGLRGGHALRHVPTHHGVDLGRPMTHDERLAMNPARAAREAARADGADAWTPPVLRAVASAGGGGPELVDALQRHFD